MAKAVTTVSPGGITLEDMLRDMFEQIRAARENSATSRNSQGSGKQTGVVPSGSYYQDPAKNAAVEARRRAASTPSGKIIEPTPGPGRYFGENPNSAAGTKSRAERARPKTKPPVEVPLSNESSVPNRTGPLADSGSVVGREANMQAMAKMHGIDLSDPLRSRQMHGLFGTMPAHTPVPAPSPTPTTAKRKTPADDWDDRARANSPQYRQTYPNGPPSDTGPWPTD